MLLGIWTVVSGVSMMAGPAIVAPGRNLVQSCTGVSAMQVASDLRFMIAKRFAETGIEIAFPQRDVHLDA